MEPAIQQDVYKGIDLRALKNTGTIGERSRLYERFFVYILYPWDLYLLVFFLDLQTLCQVFFARDRVYSVRNTPIYLLFSYHNSLVKMITTRVKISEFPKHIQAPWASRVRHGLTVALLLHYACDFWLVLPFTIKRVTFPDQLSTLTGKPYNLSSCKSATGKIIQPQKGKRNPLTASHSCTETFVGVPPDVSGEERVTSLRTSTWKPG